MNKRLFCRLLLAAVAALGIVLDQLTKHLAVRYLMPLDTYPIWKNVLHLTYVENRGAAFGMLADNRWIFMVISTVAILALLIWFYFLAKAYRYLSTTAIALIVSGGIGNMIDRLALGYVVDFIDLRLIRFAVFNVADSLVCIGAALLALAEVIDASADKKRPRSGESAS